MQSVFRLPYLYSLVHGKASHSYTWIIKETACVTLYKLCKYATIVNIKGKYRTTRMVIVIETAIV